MWNKFEPGPWHMGKFSFWVNMWAIVWTFFVSIIFILPTVRPVAADTMNYAIAFLGLIFIAAYMYWFISGRKFYHGPISETHLVEGESQDLRDGESPSEKLEKERVRDEVVR